MHTLTASQRAGIYKDTREREMRDELKNQTLRQSTRKKTKSIRSEHPSENEIQSKHFHASNVLLVDDI